MNRRDACKITSCSIHAPRRPFVEALSGSEVFLLDIRACLFRRVHPAVIEDVQWVEKNWMYVLTAELSNKGLWWSWLETRELPTCRNGMVWRVIKSGDRVGQPSSIRFFDGKYLLAGRGRGLTVLLSIPLRWKGWTAHFTTERGSSDGEHRYPAITRLGILMIESLASSRDIQSLKTPKSMIIVIELIISEYL